MEAGHEEELEHEPWYRPPPPGCCVPYLLFWLVLPLKAAMHLTVPDVFCRWPWNQPRFVEWYPATLLMSVAWLGVLAFVMTIALDNVGCALGISSTVMGLTLGAMGTSFPNLYASILTAMAGQARPRPPAPARPLQLCPLLT